MAEFLALTEVATRPGLAARPVAWRDGQSIPRERFVADVAAWAAAFAQCAGEAVALYFDDAYEFAAALYGAWHAGKRVVLPGDALPATVAHLLPMVGACAGDLPGAISPVAGHSAVLAPLDLDRTSLVVYTSGSNGQPTAIPKRLAQLDAEVRNLESAFGDRLQGDCAICSTVSHQHIYGLLFVTLWPLAAGRPVDTQRIAYPEHMAARLAQRDAVLVSSPAHLKRLPAELAWDAARQRLRAVFSSGGPLPPDSAHEALAALGHSPTEVYGSSETGGIAWRQRAAHGDRWQALPGVAWRLDEETLAVRSPHLPDAATWWETTDRAHALDDGGFVLLGRADRIAKIGEKRISLTAVEASLCTHPHVAEARVLPLADEAGERLAAVIVPTPDGWDALRTLGKRRFNEGLRDSLRSTVEQVALPRRFRHVRTLPVNTQGKSTEALLAALFRPLVPPPDWMARTPDRAQLEIDITPELLVLDGHFPGAPVLPGVAQLHWAIAWARECFDLPPRFLRVEALKFNQPVRPGVRLVVTLAWSAETGSLSFECRVANAIHASGRAIFGADAA